MKYEEDILYTAYVEAKYNFHRIYFMFHYSSKRTTQTVFIKKDLKDRWDYYDVGMPPVLIRHALPEGSWDMTIKPGQYPTWEFKSNRHVYIPDVHKMDDDDYKGKHPEATIEDDMVDAIGYAVTVEKDVSKDIKAALEWCEKAQGIDFANPLQPKITLQPSKMRQGIITNITEGGTNMKSLYHVLIFNTKDEVIAFKEYISAKDKQDAVMLAAQRYGSYDSNDHIVIAKYIDGSDYNVK